MKKRVLSLLLAVCMLAALLWFPAGTVQAQPEAQTTVEATDLNVPKIGEELRQLALDYAHAISEVEWTCKETVDFTKAVWWSPDLIYHAGQVYHGLPYTSDRPSNNANLAEFLSWRNDNGEYVGPGSWNEMPGGDCGGIARLGYAWAGALYNVEMEELQFDPGEMSQSFGLMPLGDYDWTGFARPVATNKSINQANGEKKMYECYSMLRPGDCVFVLYPGGGEHIMMVSGEPTVVTDGNGKIIPETSMVPILEWTSAIHDKGAFKSNFNDRPYSYKELFDTGFIPLTMAAFSKETVETPTFTNTGIRIGGEVGFHDLMSGKVTGNYNIFTLTATITDAAGKVVAEGISYPNALRASLTELSYGADLVNLPAGSYHYTLKAQIGYGEATIVDTDIQYTGCEGAPVVYISDTGTGNGATPETAMGDGDYYAQQNLTSYREGSFYKALEMLSDCGGTVVVCGDVTLSCGRALTRYTSLLTPFTAPVSASSQMVTITSSFDGVDYRETVGAEVIMRRSANQAMNLELNIGSTWRDVDFRLDYNYAMMPAITTGTITALLSCGNHKTVFEESFGLSISLKDKPIEEGKQTKYYPRLFGGYYNLATAGDTDLTVLGGRWSTIIGGGHESYLNGGTNVTIGGNAVIYDGIFGGSSNNQATLCGDVNLNITGGTIGGKLVVGGSSAFGVEDYKIHAVISGKPDLSKLRIVNAGTIEKASEVVLDMGGFQNGGENFTAYVNQDEYTTFVPAPEPELEPEANVTVIIIIAAAAVVVMGGVAVVIVLLSKKKRQNHSKGEA